MTAPYGADLAFIHDDAFTALSRNATPYLLAVLRRAVMPGGTVIELGCGSGTLLRALADAGYTPVGVDRSAAMLDLARQAAPAAALVQASLHDVTWRHCGAVLAIGEGLNYVDHDTHVPDTRALFAAVAGALSPGGVFIFDVMVREPAAQRHYRMWTSGEAWYVLVEVDAEPDGTLLRRRIVTFRRDAQTWRRSEELHLVRLFDAATLTHELESAGFVVQTGRRYGQARLAPGRLRFTCHTRSR